MKAGGYLFRIGGTLFALAVLTAATVAQEGGDLVFEIKQFAGLNLYKEKTALEPGEALLAQNVQFRKPGTISTLEGLTLARNAVTGYEALGLGGIADFVNDSDRLISAFGRYFYNTYGNSLTNWTISTAQSTGDWIHLSSSTIYTGDASGRAAEFWRRGWKVLAEASPGPGFDTLTIDYITQNNSFKVSANPDISDTFTLEGYVLPVLADTLADVKDVNIEVDGVPMVVRLQAGMEPVLYDGGSIGTMRFFGVADSGNVQRVDTCDGTGGEMFIVDNTKYGVYSPNEMSVYQAGYWLHLPYNYTVADSTQWGRVWMIDSTTATDTSSLGVKEFRIYFTVGPSGGFMPAGWGSGLEDSLRGSRYQLLSAPFLGDELTSAQTPNAKIVDMGTYVKLAAGTVTPRAWDHMPHVLQFTNRADTVSVEFVKDSFLLCSPTPPFECVWVPGFTAINSIARAGTYSLPIRTTFQDTVGTDSTVIWTSGRNPAYGTTDFETSDWAVVSARLPYASDGIVYEDRLVLGGDPNDPNFFVYSEPMQMGAFPAKNFFRLPSNGDVFRGFALIYGWLLIFQENHTWAMKNGVPQDGGTLELVLPDEGCIARKSIVNVGNRVLYLSHKGWRLFDANDPIDFALAIAPAVQGEPRVDYSVNQGAKGKSAAAFNATTGNVWMSMPFGTSTKNNGSFLFNAKDGSLSYSSEVYGGQLLSMSFRDTTRLFFTHPDSGYIFAYGYTDSLDVTGVDRNKMQSLWSTGWLDMGTALRYKWISDGVLDVALSSPNSSIDSTRRLYLRMYRDFDTTAFYVDTTNVVGILGGKHYEVQTSVRLQPNADSSTVQWVRMEIEGAGLNLMDVQRLALRYTLGTDVVRDRTVLLRP